MRSTKCFALSTTLVCFVASKPENVYRRSVHKYLPSSVYHEKIKAELSAGTPDDYYEGSKGILWAEWKYLKKLPVRYFTPALSKLQARWLRRAYENGVQVRVIVGTPQGAILLETPGEWENRVYINDYTPATRKEVAEYITQGVTHACICL